MNRFCLPHAGDAVHAVTNDFPKERPQWQTRASAALRPWIRLNSVRSQVRAAGRRTPRGRLTSLLLMKRASQAGRAEKPSAAIVLTCRRSAARVVTVADAHDRRSQVSRRLPPPVRSSTPRDPALGMNEPTIEDPRAPAPQRGRIARPKLPAATRRRPHQDALSINSRPRGTPPSNRRRSSFGVGRRQPS